MIKLPYLIIWCIVAIALLVTFAVLFSIERKKAPCVPVGCRGCENLTDCHTSACTANELIGRVNADPIARKDVAKQALLEKADQLLTDADVFNALVQHPTIKSKLQCPPKPHSSSGKTLMIVLLVVGGIVILGLIVFFLLRRSSPSPSPIRFSPVRSFRGPKSPALQHLPLRARSVARSRSAPSRRLPSPRRSAPSRRLPSPRRSASRREENALAELSPSEIAVVMDDLYREAGPGRNRLLKDPEFRLDGGHMNWKHAAALEGGPSQLLLA